MRLRVVVMALAASVMIGMLLMLASRERDDPEIDDVEDEEAASVHHKSQEDGGADQSPADDTAAEDDEENGEKRKRSKDEIKAEFNAAKQKAFELFKAQPPRYENAAEHFTAAIALAEKHESLASQRVALYNNRSACRERLNELEASLADCAVVLEANKMHAKVRRRRARIYEQLGRFDDALVEICADLLIQREDFKRALKEGKQPEAPVPVDNVETVMRAVGRADADKVLRDREARGIDFGMPSSNTITQLLMTYVNYAERQHHAEHTEASDATLAKLLDAAESDADAIRLLLRRAKKFTYTKRYDEAKQDVETALAKVTPDTTLDPSVSAELWRQAGLFRHLSHDLARAIEAYERSLQTETEPTLRAETRVKLAGVYVDATDAERAETELNRALDEEPQSSDVYMHRAQLHVIKRDLPAAQRDLERCVAAAPNHVLARLRLATVLIHNSADPAVIDHQIEAAEKLAPTMSEVYQVKGEIRLAKQDLHTAIADFDKAIALDAYNPVPLYNKGLALIQLNQFDTHRTQQLFEAALKVDPTCMVALMRLSELKLQLAVSFDQAQEVVDMLANATQKCRDKDELVELATVRCMAIAQLAAAKEVGLTSFQM